MAERRLRMSSLQSSVLLLCLVVFTLALATSSIFSLMLEGYMFEKAIQPLAVAAIHEMEEHVKLEAYTNWGTEESLRHFQDFSSGILSNKEVKRINVYNEDGLIIWSTDEASIGILRFSDDIAAALRGDMVYGRTESTNEDGRSENTRFSEVYFLASVGGRPVVLELYYDLAALDAFLFATRVYVALVSFFAALILAGALTIIFRKINQQMFKQSHELRTLFEKSPVGMLVLDANGRIESANPAMQTLVGDSHVGALVDRQLGQLSFVTPRVQEMLRHGLDGHPTDEILKCVPGKKDCWQHVRVIPFLNSKGRITRMLAMFEDVSDQKRLEMVLSRRASSLEHGMQEQVVQLQVRAKELEEINKESDKNKQALLNVIEDARHLEHQLQSAHKRLEAIISSIGDAVYVVDEKDRVVLMNEAAERVFGRHFDAVRGKPVSELYEVYVGSKLQEQKDSLLRVSESSGQTIRVGLADNVFFKTIDGRRFAVTQVIAPLGGERYNGSVVVIRDVTEEKRVDESKTNFISIASHQLRTPLTAIRWLTELLVKESSAILPPTQQGYVEDIMQATGRMITLVNALLNVSRIESGRLKVLSKKIQIMTLINEVVDELSIAARGSHCAIDLVKPRKTLPAISLDRDLMRQVFQNLLTNAIRYSRPNTCQISIKCHSDKDHIFIEVSDNGIGIPDDAQHRIFEKFYRASNAAKSQTDGTGLGLYITRLIVEMAGGTIHFDSKEGVGTTFYISLPLKGMQQKQGEVGLISNSH